MCKFFAVTPFSFSLTEPHERNYVKQIKPCKMLQPLGVCSWSSQVFHENVSSQALISGDVLHCKEKRPGDKTKYV